MEHGNIVITHLCTLRTPWSVPVYETHTSEKTRPDGVCWLGGGRLISLHSDKLCSVDMPPALNKPVAAPRVESIASTVLDRRRIKCMKKCITRAFLMFLLHSVSWHIFVLNYMLVYRSPHCTQRCSFIFFCNRASPLLQKNNIPLECYVSKLQDITDFLHLRAETEWAINVKRQQKDSELSACNKVKRINECTSPKECSIFLKKRELQNNWNSPNFCLSWVNKNTSTTWEMYHWEVCGESSRDTCKPTGTAVLSFPLFIQGSVPRLLMHLPVSKGWK